METVTGVTVRGYKAGVHIRTFDVPFFGSYDQRLVSDVSDIDEMSIQFFIRVNPPPVFSPSSPLNLSLEYNEDAIDCCDGSYSEEDEEDEEDDTESDEDSCSDDSEDNENEEEVGEMVNS